jgi:hypothetical protein
LIPLPGASKALIISLDSLFHKSFWRSPWPRVRPNKFGFANDIIVASKASQIYLFAIWVPA